MTKLETTFFITFIGTLFITKFVLKNNELVSISCLFILGYLLHFVISKFESNAGTNLVQHDETNMYKNTLKNIPIVIENLYTFEEFLNKCDTKLYNQFYNECFADDCYEPDNCKQHYTKFQRYFTNLLNEQLRK